MVESLVVRHDRQLGRRQGAARRRTRWPPSRCRLQRPQAPARPPVMTMTSGFRPLTTVAIIAPSAWHASSTMAAAIGLALAGQPEDERRVDAPADRRRRPRSRARRAARPRGPGRPRRCPGRSRRPRGSRARRTSTAARRSSPARGPARRRSRRRRGRAYLVTRGRAPIPVPSASITSERSAAARDRRSIPPSTSALTSLSTKTRHAESLGQLARERPARQLGDVSAPDRRCARRPHRPGRNARRRCRRWCAACFGRGSRLGDQLDEGARERCRARRDRSARAPRAQPHPARVTTPAAIVVPPTSTPSSNGGRGIAEPRRHSCPKCCRADAERRRGRRARRRSRARPSRSRAGGRSGCSRDRCRTSRVGMNSDTPGGSARRCASVRAERPVGVRPGLAEEVIGRAQADAPRARPRLRVLAAHGHAERARRRRARRRAPARTGPRGGACRDASAAASPASRSARSAPRPPPARRAPRPAPPPAARRARTRPLPSTSERPRVERLAQREVDVQPQAQAAVASPGQLLTIDVQRDHHRGARDDAVAVRGQDPRAHAAREAEIVGVDDQHPLTARRPSMTKRSTLSGNPRGSVPSASISRRCSSRS